MPNKGIECAGPTRSALRRCDSAECCCRARQTGGTTSTDKSRGAHIALAAAVARRTLSTDRSLRVNENSVSAHWAVCDSHGSDGSALVDAALSTPCRMETLATRGRKRARESESYCRELGSEQKSWERKKNEPKERTKLQLLTVPCATKKISPPTPSTITKSAMRKETEIRTVRNILLERTGLKFRTTC